MLDTATVVSVDGGDGDGDVDIDADGAIVAADGAVQYNVAFDEFIDEETNEKLIEEDVLASRVRPRLRRRRRLRSGRRVTVTGSSTCRTTWWEATC